jgi:polar amino acid transport system substrate-binding protein
VRKSPIALVAATAVALTLTACSTGENAGGKFDVSTIEKDDAIAALLPEAIASAGTLVVGADLSYAPAEYLDEDGTTPIGYDVDLTAAIAAVLGVEADVQAADFTAIIPAIGSKYDVGISSFTITGERMDQVNMVQYFQAGESFATQAGNPGEVDAADICGRIVGVQTGTWEDELLTEAIAQCEEDGKEAPEPLRYESQADVTTALVGGKADLMWADSPVIAYAITQSAGKLEALGDVRQVSPQGIVVSKDDAALTEAIQKAVQKLIDDGVYLEILEAWGNADGAVTEAVLNPDVS